jgi:hypothetical protein
MKIQSSGGTASKFGIKADFIRRSAASMTAKDVVEAAKKAGIKVTVNHVYNVRANAKKRRGVAGAKPGPKPRAADHAPGLEAQLRGLIAQIGLQRARQVFTEVQSRFTGS